MPVFLVDCNAMPNCNLLMMSFNESPWRNTKLRLRIAPKIPPIKCLKVSKDATERYFNIKIMIIISGIRRAVGVFAQKDNPKPSIMTKDAYGEWLGFSLLNQMINPDKNSIKPI